MKHLPGKVEKGFTLFDLLITIALVVVLLAKLLPMVARRTARSSRINCVNNLKQIGLAWRTWTLDNNDTNQFQLQISKGGSKELVGQGRTYIHFAVMSNELSTPKVLICPDETDKSRRRADTFDSTVPPGSLIIPFAGDTNISYFVAVDADERYPQMFLSGDRQFGISNKAFAPGFYAVSTNTNLRWFDSPHKNQGNILLSDGSVQQVSDTKLGIMFQTSGAPTNHFEIP